MTLLPNPILTLRFEQDISSITPNEENIHKNVSTIPVVLLQKRQSRIVEALSEEISGWFNLKSHKTQNAEQIIESQ